MDLNAVTFMMPVLKILLVTEYHKKTNQGKRSVYKSWGCRICGSLNELRRGAIQFMTVYRQFMMRKHQFMAKLIHLNVKSAQVVNCAAKRRMNCVFLHMNCLSA